MLRTSWFGRLRGGLVVPVAVGVGAAAWILRFNDPGGTYAGLTDDHFFYLARGWQILLGELPVRDFVDQGAPLFYYTAAAVQTVFGRGTLSEVAFCVTMLAIGAALTFWLASRASGSILAGLAGVFFHLQLGPRFYNYPKILVYALAIPLLWCFADRPSPWRRFWLAVVTVAGFLFRHDHGVFVAVATVVMLAFLTSMPWRERMRHGLLYAVTCLVLVAPYAAFVQLNGGVSTYGQQVAAWAERERERTPPEWPGLFENTEAVSDAGGQGSVVTRAVAIVQDNIVAWTYYFELGLPILSLLILAGAQDGFRASWPHTRAKLATVAVLALVLDAGFLRSPLEARLADPSVPHAVLIAWLLVTLPRFVLTGAWLPPRLMGVGWLLRSAGAVVGVVFTLVLWSQLTEDVVRRLERAYVTDGLGDAIDRVGTIAERLRTDWDLESWMERPDRPGLRDLALYVNACTQATDRVFVQAYMPQVLALARRGFAGGHADLRPGFFATDAAQRLTVERLGRQSVPIMLLETEDEYQNFRNAFPRIVEHLDREYVLVGTQQFDGRFGTTLFVRRDRVPEGVYDPFGWPCFGPGTVQP